MMSVERVEEKRVDKDTRVILLPLRLGTLVKGF